MRVTKENTVGLVIDIQERLFPVMYEKGYFLKNCKILIEGLGKLSVPTMATQQYTKGLGGTLPEIESLMPGFEYFEKSNFSCCDEPEIYNGMKNMGAKNVIICGIESHICVLQTAVDLKESGLNPIVVMDCVSSRTKESIELAKERFRFDGIMMASCESILFELARTSGTPEFRAISKLVK